MNLKKKGHSASPKKVLGTSDPMVQALPAVKSMPPQDPPQLVFRRISDIHWVLSPFWTWKTGVR